MGSRADFYVGRGKNAEWLGSVAWDGYPGGINNDGCVNDGGPGTDHPIFDATTEAGYRKAVGEHLVTQDDTTWPEHGWPWPWENSNTTDYAYAFDGGKVYCSNFGSDWFEVDSQDKNWGEPFADTADWDDPEFDEEAYNNYVDSGPQEFPDMTDKKNVTFGKRSGVIIYEVRKPEEDT